MCRADGLHTLPLRDAVRVSAAPEEVTRVFGRLTESILTLRHQRFSGGEEGRHGTPGPGAPAARQDPVTGPSRDEFLDVLTSRRTAVG
ncbi:hypothetical protein [Streptomyces sp. NPDC101234]|uniref:hypothetical protein n=1 Tax=Streptomyces sp. NPDC101234 TaxID=3366138 RepID=UPI00382F33E7